MQPVRSGLTSASELLDVPSDMAVRFVALIMLLAAEAVGVFAIIGPPSGTDLTAIAWCGVRTGVINPAAVTVDGTGYLRCIRPDAIAISGSVIGGLAATMAVALLLAWITPWWQRWRWVLRPVSAATPALSASLHDLAKLADLGQPPRFFIDYRDLRPRGQVFGRFGAPSVRLGYGLVILREWDPRAFRGVVLHELAHVRNRDVGLTYSTIAAWRAFLLVVLVPTVISLVEPNVLSGHPVGLDKDVPGITESLVPATVLALVVLLTRNSVLRAREVRADVTAATWDTATGDLIRRAASRRSPRRDWWRWLAVHPDPPRRLAAIADPARLLFPSWMALALAALAATALSAPMEPAVVLALAVAGIDAHAAPWATVINSVLLAVPLALFLPLMGTRASRLRSLTGNRAVDWRACLAACTAVLAGLLAGDLVDISPGIGLSGVLANFTVPTLVEELAQALLIVAAWAVLASWRGLRPHTPLSGRRSRNRIPRLMAATAILLSGGFIASGQLIATAFQLAPAYGTVPLVRVWTEHGGLRLVASLAVGLNDVIVARSASEVSQACATVRAVDATASRFPPIPDAETELQWLQLLQDSAKTVSSCQPTNALQDAALENLIALLRVRGALGLRLGR
jgi:Zn-dependent protease with chaperone function